ncbi:MAG: sugar transferase [Proteobacteria bacterium]|nr:sugar transferase [Pseudomonadota bacterium]
MIIINGYLGRHRVKPGITGWAQIHGLRGETRTLDEMKQRVQFDLHYIERWSILLDLRILLMTPFTVLSLRNAY